MPAASEGPNATPNRSQSSVQHVGTFGFVAEHSTRGSGLGSDFGKRCTMSSHVLEDDFTGSERLARFESEGFLPLVDLEDDNVIDIVHVSRKEVTLQVHQQD